MDDTTVFDPRAKPTKKVEIAPQTGERMHTDFVFDPSNTPTKLAAHMMTEREPQSGLIKAWSPSALKTFEGCHFRSFLQKVLKLETQQHPAAARGVEYHDNCEHFVDGTIDEFPEVMLKSAKFKTFLPKFERLRDLYLEGKIELEGEWGFDKDWKTTEWLGKTVWARMKLDALEWTSDVSAKIIDYKTGRKFGNEVTHADQGMIYTVGSFMRHPTLEVLDVDFWYLDQGEHSFAQRFTRAQAMNFLPRISARALRLTTAVEKDFTPSPSVYNCQWCDFNREENGCEWRIGK